jgi:glycosyltransferase involved in cell wall biosynthesis
VVSEAAFPHTRQAPGDAVIWIDWDRHLRTRSMASRLGVELLELVVPGGRLHRYRTCLAATLRRLRALRPRVVIATNPSLVLACALLALRRPLGFALVLDAHYLGVHSLSRRGLAQRVLDFVNARADLVIVTNPAQSAYIGSLGGRSFICPDPLPDLPPPLPAATPQPERSVFLVCSFDPDEPYRAAFAAFRELSQRGYVLLVSGNYRKAGLRPEEFPWVRFLGYVSEDRYYDCLRGCELVMDLTTLEDCLMCGAYEALAAGRPLILSRTSAVESYFGAGALLTHNTPAAIAASVEEGFARREMLAAQARAWAQANEAEMSTRLAALSRRLRELAPAALPLRVPSS